ncbi:MAG: tannase/feruloyl esterase family alpha/beta hydrolase, partial [Vicinamibacterales bacterium]
MIRRTAVVLALALLSVLTEVMLTAALPGTPCTSLASLTIPSVTINAATVMAAGSFMPPGAQTAMALPAFCRVEATARPTTDSEIKFEVWIPPTEAWNGKFQGVGN